MLTPEELTALKLSAAVGISAVALSLPFAIAIAYVLAKQSNPARGLLQIIVDLPLVLPPVVTGYLLLLWFRPSGFLGSILERGFGIRVVFSLWGAVVASAVISFPLMVRAIRLAFEAIDPRLVRAARSLGAGPVDAFLSITLPLALRGITVGCVLAFARGLGEFGATIMVAGNIEGETRTIPLAIYSLTSRPGGVEQSWRLIVISILLACAALAASGWIERKRRFRELA